mgnify:CR=1 FL=1
MYVGFFHENRRCMNKIVYVEDEPEVGQLIAAYLGKHDMDVIVEPRGDRAEEVVVRENPDLVLLDVRMPGFSGLEVQRRLKEMGQHIPIVFITGHAGNVDTVNYIGKKAGNGFVNFRSTHTFYHNCCDNRGYFFTNKKKSRKI